jgi:hypothetical protein
LNVNVQETRIGHITMAFAVFHHAVSASFIPLHVTSVAPNGRRSAARFTDKPESAAAGETELDEPSGNPGRCVIRARGVLARPRLVFLR